MSERKNALVVRGGWDGHQPYEATELFIPYLKDNGYDAAFYHGGMAGPQHVFELWL